MARKLLDRARFGGGRTLDLYVLERFLFLYAANLICFTVIYIVIDLFENLGDFARHEDSLAFAFRYYGSMLPAVFCQLLGPIVALTSGLFTLTLLHRQNELVPMLANGIPGWRIFLPVLVAGFVTCTGTFFLQELWVPHTADAARELAGRKEGRTVLENRKFLDAEHGKLLVIKKYYVLDERAEGVTVIPTSSLLGGAGKATAGREYYIQAREMRWVEPALDERGYWLLERGLVQTYDAAGSLVVPEKGGLEGVPPVLYENFAERDLETSLLPQDLEAEKEDTTYMRLDDLRRRMDEGVDRRWTVRYYSRFASPLSALVLLLVGLPALAHYGSRNIFFGAVVAALVSTAYFVFGSVVSNLALRGFFPGALGAWLAPITFSSLGVTWLRYLRV